MSPDSIEAPPRVSINELAQHDGQMVTLYGWLYGKRSGGKVVFLLVRDGTGLCQCVVEAAQPEAFRVAETVGQESSMIVSGRVRNEPRAPGGWELAVTGLHVLQSAENYPISRKAHGVDFLLNHRHLWLRSPRQVALLRIRHTLMTAARQFFDALGFTLIDTPILTPGAAEGAGTLFSVDYFGEPIYLTQTGQLYLESACMALGKVYCFGPTFRAEKSKTRRHLTEFWMLEPEVAFAELPDLIELAESLVVRLVAAVLERHPADLALLGRDPAPLKKIVPPFPRLTYTEAVDLIQSAAVRESVEQQIEEDRQRLNSLIAEVADLEKEKAAARKGWQVDKFEQQIRERRDILQDLETDLRHRQEHLPETFAFRWGGDLGADEEAILSRQFDRPVFVTEYPRQAKAFYMKPAPHDPRVVLNMDLLAPEGYGEIIGGSQREDQVDALQSRINEEGLDPADYEWYLDLRRYGSVPHGGFGLGLERALAWICGLRHIREAIPFPRMIGRITP